MTTGYAPKLPEWVAERPRERLLSAGAGSLADADLVALMLGSGVSGRPVGQLALEVLGQLDRNSGRAEPGALQAIAGVGPARAASLAAAMELARRYQPDQSLRIRSPADVYPLIRHFADRPQEMFVSVSLNGAHQVVRVEVVSVGLVNRTMVHPREVFAPAITARAAALVVAHNHPSGILDPSEEDQRVTARLRAAGELIGIPILDHLIFSDRAFYSFLEAGQLSG